MEKGNWPPSNNLCEMCVTLYVIVQNVGQPVRGNRKGGNM